MPYGDQGALPQTLGIGSTRLATNTSTPPKMPQINNGTLFLTQGGSIAYGSASTNWAGVASNALLSFSNGDLYELTRGATKTLSSTVPAYDSATSYAPMSLVFVGQKSYVARKTTLGANPPNSPEDWFETSRWSLNLRTPFLGTTGVYTYALTCGFTPMLGLPLVASGDRNIPEMLSEALRKIDARASFGFAAALTLSWFSVDNLAEYAEGQYLELNRGASWAGNVGISRDYGWEHESADSCADYFPYTYAKLSGGTGWGDDGISRDYGWEYETVETFDGQEEGMFLTLNGAYSRNYS